MIFFYTSPLNCEETNKEDISDQKDENVDTRGLRISIIALTIAFQLGVSPEEPTEDKMKYMIVLVFTAVVSTMFGRWLNERLYGTDPKTQAKIAEDLIKEIEKLEN